MKYGSIILLLFMLSATLVSAQATSTMVEKVTGVIDKIVEVVNYLFGFGFSDRAANLKVEVMTRLSVFLIVLVLVMELCERILSLSPRASRAIAVSLSLITSFSITGDILRAISASWGGLVAFTLLIIPILALGALVVLIPSTTRPHILFKMFLVVVIIWLATSQAELVAGPIPQEPENPFENAVTNFVVYPIPYDYYPPNRYSPYGGR